MMNNCEHSVNKFLCAKCKHLYKCSHGRQCYTRCRYCLGYPPNKGKCSRCKKPSKVKLLIIGLHKLALIVDIKAIVHTEQG